MEKTTKFRVLQMLVSGVFLVTMMVTATMSQTAKQWFERGVNSDKPGEKITAYQRAIADDSSLVEAYYNLALTYKKQGDYASAEQILEKGFTRHANEMESDLKIKLLFELGMISKKMSNFERAEEALTAAANLTTNEKLRANLMNELGRTCLLSGNYDKAILHFSRGRELASDKEKDIFTKGIQMAQNEKLINELYNNAMAYYNKGEMDDARTAFEKVVAINPNFKDATARLNQTRSTEKRLENDQEIEKIYQEAIAAFNAQNYSTAIQKFEQVLAKNSGYRDARQRLDEAKTGLEAMNREEMLAQNYDEGMRALRRGSYTEAMFNFERVRRLDPNYRDVQNRLTEANSGLQKGDLKQTVATFYYQGKDCFDRSEYEDAISAFKRVLALSPDYKDTADLLVQAQDKLSTASSTAGEVEKFYNQGLEYLATGDYLQAIIAFEKVQMLDKQYKSVVEKLVEAKVLLKKSDDKLAINSNNTSRKLLATIGIVLGFLLVPTIGIYAFSPEMRARVKLLQGKYSSAVKIYEKLLIKNPSKVKLYLALANVYMLENRRDDQAVKAFEMVLRLNMDTNHKDEMMAILANHYLREGRTDAEALEIMEQAAKQKMNQTKR